MHSNSIHRRGAISLGLAWVTTTLSLGVAVVQDWYVDVSHPGCGTGNGTQADPFCDIMDAVSAAANGDTIHIAPGTYFENVVLDRDLHLIGTGGEAVTILDGTASGSVVHVSTAGAALTGLTLTKGAATFGGGLYVGHSSGATLTNCTVTGNAGTSAYSCGGGIYVAGSDHGIVLLPGTLVLTSSTVTGNSAALGGGLYGGPGWGLGGPSRMTITNSLVSGNSAAGGAGGIKGGSLAITNTTVSYNSAGISGYGGGILVADTGGLTLGNSVLWGNAGGQLVAFGSPPIGVVHSLVEGGWAGTGNIDADPLFVDPSSGDFRLMPGSPCIDAGDNTAVPTGIIHDIRGAPRLWDDPFALDTGVGSAPVVDMGAYEFFRRFRNPRDVPVR